MSYFFNISQYFADIKTVRPYLAVFSKVIQIKRNSEKIAELSGILNIGVKIYEDRFEIYSENISVARRIYKLIKEINNKNIFRFYFVKTVDFL